MKDVCEAKPDLRKGDAAGKGAAADGACACRAHGAEEGNEKSEMKRTFLRLGIATAVCIAGAYGPIPEAARIWVVAAAYLLAGGDILWNALRNLGRGQVFDENFLMSIASLGAFAIGETTEAVAVMVFYGIGEALQESAAAKSRKNIEQLMDLRSDSATLLVNGERRVVSPETIKLDDLIEVKPGEKIPLDGVVESGSAFLDTQALTGESVPRAVRPGSEVLSGMIASDAVLRIRVTKLFSESTVAKILKMVRNAAEKKSPTEKFITKFARWYTPAVVVLAILVAVVPPLLSMGAFSDWFYKALSFLIISCPCALVLSIPLSFFAGIGASARNGILVKGGTHLEALAKVGTVAFDKTGTLTRGSFEVSELIPAEGVSKDELLKCAALAEAQSNHPIAKSILAAYGAAPEERPAIRELAGLGVVAKTSAGRIHSGNARLMEKLGIQCRSAHAKTTVHVARDGKYLGCILFSDQLKPGVAQAMRDLKARGVERLVMLTGDAPAIAEHVAKEAGVDSFRAGLMPQDKITELEKLMASAPNDTRTAFVGDGINDAPALSRADVGIAMGGIGSDAAIEAADAVIMTDDIAKVATAIAIAQKTKRIVWQNIVGALGLKALVMLLSVVGFASVWFAIFADVGVALLAVANSLRALRIRNIGKGESNRIDDPAPSGGASGSAIEAA